MTSSNFRAIAQLSATVKDLKAACKRRNLLPDYHKYIALKEKRQRRQEPIPTVREFLRIRLIEKANRIAKFLPAPCYNMGDVVKIQVGNHFAGYHDDTAEYSRSCRYKAKHGYAFLLLSVGDFSRTKIIGGLVTILDEKVNSRTYKCSWFSNKGGDKHKYRLERINGFLIRGHHISAASLQEAEEIVAEKRKAAAIRKLSSRADSKLSKLAKSLDLSRIFVTLDDSLRAGNCLAGTKNYADRKQINLSQIGAVRADWLIENQNGSGYYITRAIEAARIRYAAMLLNK